MKKYWLEMVIVIIFIIKLWIVNVQPIYVKGAAHDDGLFTREAISIVEGNWLGEYNDTTLSKGVIGALFIALANKIGISYLLAQQILYFLSCISMIYMLKHVIKNKSILLLCYVVLLMNPISYSDAFSFVYRDRSLYCTNFIFYCFFISNFFQLQK